MGVLRSDYFWSANVADKLEKRNDCINIRLRRSKNGITKDATLDG
jgi:hypothetical protein